MVQAHQRMKRERTPLTRHVTLVDEMGDNQGGTKIKVKVKDIQGSKKSSSFNELEGQLILRIPEPFCNNLETLVQNGSLKDKLSIEILPDKRRATIKISNTKLSARLVDLPCIIESWKTFDKKSLWKTADICQMLICKQGESELSSDEDTEKISDPYKRQMHQNKKYQCPHGVTPPLKNVRKRRFRKTAKKKYIESPEIEKEVKRLLRADISAVDVTYEVLQEEEKQDDADARSVVSDLDVGGIIDPGTMPMSEDLPNVASSDNENEVSAILPELSSSEDEGESMKDDGLMDMTDSLLDMSESQSMDNVNRSDSGPLSEHYSILQGKLYEVRAKRAEQEKKIRDAANPFLKQRFQHDLEGIMKQEEDLMAEMAEMR